MTQELNSNYKTISILDAETGEVRHDIKRKNFIGAVAFSPDGQALAIGDLDGRVALYDVATGSRRRMQRQPQASPAAPAA